MLFRALFFLSALVVFSLRASLPLQAQCLELAQLDRGIAAGKITPDSLLALLEEGRWLAHKGANPYWTYRTTGETETPEDQAQAWVGLRRNNQQTDFDLVYKTKQLSCINRVLANLRRRAKLQAEPINCVKCVGERFVGPGYTVSVFNQKENYEAKRAAYPYVLVIHRVPAGAGNKSSAAETSSFITP